MSANFNVQFRINEKTQTRVIRLTDTSSGFTLAKGNFSVTFPDGSTRIKTEWTSPDITSPAAYIDILAVTDNNNNVITGSYKIDFIALDAATTSYSASKTFDFNWVKPINGITDLSDVLIPQVQFKDNTSYSPIGSFTGTPTRIFSTAFPTTSEVSGQSATTTSTNTLTPVYTGNYYEGVYNVLNDITCNYTHTSNSWLTINYVELFTKTVAIKKCPTQIGLIEKINTYRGVIEAYKEKNDTQFNLLSEQYDLAIALYSHIIARYQTATQDGSEGQLRELLSILEPYTGSYTYESTRMLPFELASTGANSFNISDGTNSDSVGLGTSLLFSSGNAALVPSISNNQVNYSPVFGTAANTFAQGNDSRFHNAVTIGTANGLSLASQVLSLALATPSTSGAFSASDKAKLDGIAAGANTGTVTSIAISAPSAFSVTGSPITTSGTINISATGNPLQYITGAGALATLNTAAVPELTNLYFTNTRARAAISASGNLSYDSATGVISYTTPSETDPIFIASAAYGITNTNISNWNTAYGWGNHASAGYLLSSVASSTYQPLDGDLTAIAAISGTSGLLRKTSANTWSLDTNTYLTSFTETDPIYTASSWYTTTNNSSNWNTAFGWGNHASAGYLTSINSSQVTTALGYTPENAANKGVANGYASLDGAGLVPSTQLPSYVDDVLEYADLASLPASGTTGKIYVALDTNKIYRWSGTVYVEISSSAGGGGTWGSITGTLSNQVDLQSALDTKQNQLNGTGFVKASGTTITYDNSTYLTTSSAASTYVPYAGATGNITLGEYGLTAGYFKFDLTPTGTPTGLGTMYWDSFYRTATLIDGDGDTTLQIGQEQRVLVHNNTGSTLTDGQVVYITGSTGELPSVALASNTSEVTSSVTLGVVTETIANGADGFITTSGVVHGLNTLGLTEGAALWLGTGGAFTETKPVAPANSVLIGYVIKNSGGNGSIFVKIQNGSELDELHNVLITSVANNQGLFYESATGLWKNKTIAAVLGYTPYDAANPSNYIALTSLSSTATGLTYTNTTGVFSLTSGYVIPTTTEQSNWNTAYGWGNHASAGYLLSSTAASTYQPLDGDLTAIAALAGTSGFLKKTSANTWSLDTNTYLTSFTETDPIYTASSWYTTTNNSSNWNTAFGWGNHASAGYLTTSSAASTYQPLDADLTAIAGLSGTSGFLKKTAADTWSLDTNTYLTSITSSNVTTALGYTPVTNARTITINGTTYDLSADRSWTISGGITGSITSGYIPKASGTSTIANSRLFDGTTGVGVNTITPRASLDVVGNIYSNDIWIADNSSLLFGNLSTGSSSTYIYGVGGNGVTNYLGFATNGSEGIRLLASRQLKLNAYTATTSFTGTAAGVLAFDSSGNILTIATPGGTTLNGTGFVKASGTTISYDNSTYVPTNGSGASGTWGISISGTSGNTSSISSAVGSNYTWTGTQYFQSNLGGYSGSLSNAPLQAYSTGNNSAFMSFHKGGVYAVNMGLDADNVFRIGGWSAAANRLQLEMNGNLTLAGDVRTTGLRLNTNTSNNQGHRIFSRTVDVSAYNTIIGARFTVAGGNIVQFNYQITFHASNITGDTNGTWYLRYTGSTVYNTAGSPNERFWDLREQAGNGIAGVGRNNNNGNLEFPIAAYGEACRLTITVAMTCNNWDAVTVTFP